MIRTVAHVLPWPGIGGTEHATLRIAKAVADRGIRNIAFCRDDATEVQAFFERAGVETIPYRLTDLSLRRPAPYLRATRALTRELRRRKVDLVHCADVDAGVQAALAGRLAGLPVLCHVRNPFPVMRGRERLVLSAVTRFVFVSKDTWSSFAQRIAPSRGYVLYDGIEAIDVLEPTTGDEVRRELALGPDSRVAGMTARVSPQKDFITLGRAAVRVLEALPNARFVVVGDHEGNEVHREHYARVRAELERLGVLHAFCFTGFRSDVARVMRAFDVFVLSTHFEGLPLVVLEAMAIGLPVVATAVNGIPEVIDGDAVGLLAAHEDAEALARHLVALLSDAPRARRIGAAGRDLVRRKFSAETFAANVERLYRDTLGDRSAP